MTIQELSVQNAEGALQTSLASQALSGLAFSLNPLVARFKTH